MKTERFGLTKSGEEVAEYILENKNGIKLSLISYGAAIRSVVLPDGTDIVLGFDTVEGYENHDKYMGAVIGRCANRIKGGRFRLNGSEYTLAVNNGTNHLHGGEKGFDKKVWKGFADSDSVTFTLFSPDMEEGYPGDLNVTVKYTLSEDNEIIILYSALSTEDTIVNLTNHTYFNLDGHGSVEEHMLAIYADEFTAIDETGCSDGSILSVDKTPMDFRNKKKIGTDIEADFKQTAYAGGYDHNFILKHSFSDEIKKAASAENGKVTLEVWTDQPGVHFYSGNFLDGTDIGKNGVKYEKRGGFALETQDWPDAVNHDGFPSPILKRGNHYRSTTIFKIIE